MRDTEREREEGRPERERGREGERTREREKERERERQREKCGERYRETERERQRGGREGGRERSLPTADHLIRVVSVPAPALPRPRAASFPFSRCAKRFATPSHGLLFRRAASIRPRCTGFSVRLVAPRTVPLGPRLVPCLVPQVIP